MLSARLKEAIEREISLELEAAQHYRCCASWAHINGLPRLEKHFSAKVPEETGHADKFREFLEQCGEVPSYLAVPPVEMSGGLIEHLRSALDLELRVATAIDNMCGICMADGCHGALKMLIKFADIQVEEVDEASRFLRLAEQSDTPAEFDSSIVQ